MSGGSIPPPEGEVDEFEPKEREETAGETPSVNNENQCEEPAPAAKEDHVEVETHEEKSPGKPDYVMELSDHLAGIEEEVAMANYRRARNEILLLCMKAAMPPEKREMNDQMLAAVAEETYQTAVVAGKGPIPRLGPSSGAFTHEIDPTLKGKAASETSQTLKRKSEDCSQPEDSDADVVIIEPPAKLMGSAIAAHARGQRSGNRRTSPNWQDEVACVKEEPKDAEPEVPDTISSQGCQLLRHFEFGAEDFMRSLSRETNELPRKDVNTQRRTGLPPIPVATAENERGWGRGNRGGRAQRPAIDSPVNLIPANYRMHFRPRADMGLDVEATRLAVYIYAFVGDSRPRLTPSVVVVNTLALITSRNARRRTNATCWFLPSTFVVDILRGIVWDDVHHIYQCFWMPETTALEHADVDEAWYMIILDVRKPRVYSLDVHRTVENMARKEKLMKAVLRTLSLMFTTPAHILNFTDRSSDTSGWGRILQASGILEDLTSAETAIWACSWLSQSGGFSRNMFGPMGDEDTLWMRLASSIVGAQCNELRPAVDEAS
ncbi:hypothetical protein PIB30_045962 [Stylosanthes scabra]|uniref:Uncharacterized protein n=1 Tax=Stylosanthes scabra TaxID=79078 RepID=A0ABU6RGC5_9FABA|nr:hypothetical protein [Stylosanthes scabra]